eukprot:3696303-Pleurochrysis_carterae.AAC.1
MRRAAPVTSALAVHSRAPWPCPRALFSSCAARSPCAKLCLFSRVCGSPCSVWREQDARARELALLLAVRGALPLARRSVARVAAADAARPHAHCRPPARLHRPGGARARARARA